MTPLTKHVEQLAKQIVRARVVLPECEEAARLMTAMAKVIRTGDAMRDAPEYEAYEKAAIADSEARRELDELVKKGTA